MSKLYLKYSELSKVPYCVLLSVFHSLQNHMDHIFDELVEDGEKLLEDFASFSHAPEGQSKDKGAHNQAHHVGSFNILTHQLHFSGILKQGGETHE